MSLTCDEYLKNLSDADLLTREEIDAALADLSDTEKPTDGEALAGVLVNKGLLTAYQAQVVFRGKGHNLKLGNYIIQDKLGQGGMGMVFRAQHRKMKREVALKVVSGKMTKNEEMMQRFHREVEAAAKLNHPNIVVAHDADEAHGTWYLVMEVIDGKDLSAIVKKKGPVTIAQAVDLILQAARGLQYAHEQGVVHRDIKPSNLLLDRSGTVKILDMGLARIETEEGQAELTSTGAVMGTVDYMAPEQAVSTKHADARSDIYSLGCSLWYLLTGRPAYGGDSMMGKLLAHRDHPIPSLAGCRDDVAPELQAIFVRMIAKKAEDRYQSMGDVISDLEKFKAGDANLPAIQSMVRSEDSKLKRFQGGLSDLVSPPAQPAHTPVKESSSAKSGSKSNATLAAVSVDHGTDPESMNLPPQRKRKNQTDESGEKEWWQDRTIQIIIGFGTGLLIGVVMLLYSTGGEKPDQDLSTTDLVAKPAIITPRPSESTTAHVRETNPVNSENTQEKKRSTPPEPVNILPQFDRSDAEGFQLKSPIGLGLFSQFKGVLPDCYRLEFDLVRSSAPDTNLRAGTTEFQVKMGEHYAFFYLNNGGEKEQASVKNGFVFFNDIVIRDTSRYPKEILVTERLLRDQVTDKVTLEVHTIPERAYGRFVVLVNGENQYEWQGSLHNFDLHAEKFAGKPNQWHLVVGQWNGTLQVKSATLTELEPLSTGPVELQHSPQMREITDQFTFYNRQTQQLEINPPAGAGGGPQTLLQLARNFRVEFVIAREKPPSGADFKFDIGGKLVHFALDHRVRNQNVTGLVTLNGKGMTATERDDLHQGPLITPDRNHHVVFDLITDSPTGKPELILRVDGEEKYRQLINLDDYQGDAKATLHTIFRETKATVKSIYYTPLTGKLKSQNAKSGS